MTMTSTPQQLRASSSLEELYGHLDQAGMGPGWNKATPSLWREPHKTFRPAHWPYDAAKAALDAAGRLINTDLAERRNLILFNPFEGNTYATVSTLVAAYQMIMPGEIAREHRHTPNALRLVLDAEPGCYTVVDGEKIPMSPGDVVLTPNWSSHGHGNDGRAKGYWLDFLDVPLVQLLEPMFFEHVEAGTAKPRSQTHSLVFPWSETVRRLNESKRDSAKSSYTEIELGNPALNTVGLYMIELVPNVKTRSFRTTANNIYSVARGSGKTVVDGEEFQWTRGDVVAAPAWRSHFHEASDDAVLLRVTDEPVMKQLGFLRTESARDVPA
jgi:gentisate 1,2-dioxygenase